MGLGRMDTGRRLMELKKARRDADALIESLRLDWRELAEGSHTAEQAEGIKIHMKWCLEELEGLPQQLDADKA